jgi:O-antigen ligase
MMPRHIGGFLRRSLPPVFLFLCIALGGASGVGAGVIANALLQFIALLLILVLLWRGGGIGSSRDAAFFGALLLTFVVTVLLSLVPLPAGWWQSLPGRQPVRNGLEMLGLGQAAIPVSLAPQASIASLLWVLPPLAMFLLVLRSSWSDRRTLVTAFLVIAVISVMLGSAQLLNGPGSSLRFYQITNPMLPVGFFSNGNHQATLLLCALPFCGYLAARATKRSSAKRTSGLVTAAFTALFLAVGIATVGALAGYGLLLVVGGATLLIYRRASVGSLSKAWIGAIAALFVLFLAIAMTGPLQQEAISDKFSDDRGSRKVIAATTVEAIKDVFPVGTGLGTFADVYRSYEDPIGAAPGYTNHAHNDYLEIILELGAVGILLMIAFLLWWARRSLSVWRSSAEGGDLGRAASIVIGVVLLHSLVEYPLRPSAIAAVVAMCCALMCTPTARRRHDADSAPAEDAQGLRHLAAD